MKLNFKKENCLNTMLSIGLVLFLFFAFVGLFLPITTTFKSSAVTSTFEAAMAFEILIVILGGILAEIVQLEILEIFPKTDKWENCTRLARWVIAVLIVLFAIIAMSCAGACGKVGGGAAMCFVFGIFVAACGACIGLEDFLKKQKGKIKKTDEEAQVIEEEYEE